MNVRLCTKCGIYPQSARLRVAAGLCCNRCPNHGPWCTQHESWWTQHILQLKDRPVKSDSQSQDALASKIDATSDKGRKKSRGSSKSRTKVEVETRKRLSKKTKIDDKTMRMSKETKIGSSPLKTPLRKRKQASSPKTVKPNLRRSRGRKYLTRRKATKSDRGSPKGVNERQRTGQRASHSRQRASYSIILFLIEL